MFGAILRIIVSVLIILAVSEIARRSPRLGALLLTLPLISILAFGSAWFRDHDLKKISELARETLILVPLGLPFFIPLAFAERLGLGFWSAVVTGAAISIFAIGLWLAFGPRLS